MTIKYKTREIPNYEGLRDGCNNTVTDIQKGVFVTGTWDSITIPTSVTDPLLGVTRQIIKANGGRGSIGAGSGRYGATVGVAGVGAAGRLQIEPNTGCVVAFNPGTGNNASLAGYTEMTGASTDTIEVEIASVGALAQGQ